MHKTAEGAGCVVLRPGEREPEVLLVWTKQYPDPTLPKGHLDPGVAPWDGAVREVREETGYAVETTSAVPVTVRIVLDKHPPVVHKTIHWFPARVVGGGPERRLERELISKVDWLPIAEAVQRMRRKDEIQALLDCLELVEQSEHRVDEDGS